MFGCSSWARNRPLGDGRRHRVGVAGVEQALEHHPAVADVAVPGQVDPAEAAVGEAAEHLVLPGDELAGHQLGAEGVPGAAVRAEPLGQAGPAVARLADRLAAVTAEPPVLRDLGVGEHRRGRVERRDRRHHDQAGASRPREERPLPGREPRVPGPLPLPAWPGRSTTLRSVLTRPIPPPPRRRCRRGRAGAGTAAARAAAGRTAGARARVTDAAAARGGPPGHGRGRARGGRQAADVAVPVLNSSAAPWLGACHCGHRRPSPSRIARW